MQRVGWVEMNANESAAAPPGLTHEKLVLRGFKRFSNGFREEE